MKSGMWNCLKDMGWGRSRVRAGNDHSEVWAAAQQHNYCLQCVIGKARLSLTSPNAKWNWIYCSAPCICLQQECLCSHRLWFVSVQWRQVMGMNNARQHCLCKCSHCLSSCGSSADVGFYHVNSNSTPVFFLLHSTFCYLHVNPLGAPPCKVASDLLKCRSPSLSIILLYITAK